MRKAKTIKAKRSKTVGSGQYEYTVVFEPAEEGGYVVTVAALPGLIPRVAQLRLVPSCDWLGASFERCYAGGHAAGNPGRIRKRSAEAARSSADE